MMQQKRAQGRPARGVDEVGSQKIIDGMLKALRTLQTTEVTRKEIAEFAGVTPALITYYFPGSNALIEAAITPVVEGLVLDIKACLDEGGQPKIVLHRVIKKLLERFVHDLMIIELFDKFKRRSVDNGAPNYICELEKVLTSFFERLLADAGESGSDADFLQGATIGLCKSVARRLQLRTMPDQSTSPRQDRIVELICDMLLWSLQRNRIPGGCLVVHETGPHRIGRGPMQQQAALSEM